MTAKILDGKAIAEEVRAAVKKRVDAFVAETGRAPGLDVVVVGEDPASQVYTRNKEKASIEVGMKGKLHKLPESTTEADLLALLERLNHDDTVDGILVQLPLPKHIDERKVLDAVDPKKDVDGFHPVNVGLLWSGRPSMVPCTPSGCMHILKHSGVELVGAQAVVVGRSNIVGKPMALLLMNANATVTIAHSKTRDLPGLCRRADVLIAAIGKPEMIKGEWIKRGSIVIDVGINRVPNPEKGEGQTKLVGDVAFEEAREIAGSITPVPGGVGPMTIACLLENTLEAARRRSH